MSGGVKLTGPQRAFLRALSEHGRLSAPTGNPPVMGLAKAGLISFVRRSEELSVMELTEAGRSALSPQQGREQGDSRSHPSVAGRNDAEVGGKG